jgi:hypothetical protein
MGVWLSFRGAQATRNLAPGVISSECEKSCSLFLSLTHVLNPIHKFLLTNLSARLTLHPACTGGAQPLLYLINDEAAFKSASIRY